MEVLKTKYIELYVLVVLQWLVSLWMANGLGFFSDIDSVALASLDAQQYFEMTQFLFGISSFVDKDVLALRPLLYPLYLGSYLAFPYLYVAIQLLLNMLTIVLVYRSVLLLVPSRVFAAVSLLFFFTSFTFLLIPFSALTETLSLFLVSAAFYCVGRELLHEHSDEYLYLYLSQAIFSLLVIIKGIFLPFYAIWTVYFFWRFFGCPGDVKKKLGIVLLVFMPLFIQLGFSYSLLGKASISSAGEENFSQRFFPFVFGVAEQGAPAHYRSELAREGGEKYPDNVAKIRYLVEHSEALYVAVRFLIRDNYARGSTYIIHPQKSMRVNSNEEALWKSSIRIDLYTYALHIILLPILFLMLIFDRQYRLVIATYSAFIASIILLSVLTYNQGDRIVVVSMPVYAVLYVFVFYRVGNAMQLLARRIRSEQEQSP